ncbi:4-coumarate-CoA ligase [Rhizodiscina lignyota]|uniref:4-coumarate-CoA ligase n=1 Tax=Rhizodiscina lignyota TaxID=1504668 RepID=A0A9P4MA06_9PEZI|nr:4-coumarate-CoA ligase [Rhizodiscina lignyota]
MGVYTAAKNYDLPNVDLLTLLFESPIIKSNEDTPLHIEATQPWNIVTKSQARTYTKRIAYHLRNSFGIGANGPGKDVVVCISSGQVLLPIAFYGVIAAGGVYSAASTAFTHLELTRQVRQGGSNLIIASPDCKEVAIRAAKESGTPMNRVLILESTGSQRVLQDVERRGPNFLAGEAKDSEMLDWERITDPKALEESLICLLYSSGTTGVPKGVLVSHTNMVSEGLLPYLMNQEWQERERAKDPNFSFQYRTLAHLPAAHIAGVQGYFVNPALAGGPVYWMPKFDFALFLKYNKTYQITSFFTVPPIYLLIAKSLLVTDQFASLVHAVSGAAPMGPELQALAKQKLGCHVAQTWGLSETTGSFTVSAWDDHDDSGAVSSLMPNTRMRIVHDDGNDVPEGGEGEFVCQGPMVSRGYFGNEEATRESFLPGGWFKTGDIGVYRNGKCYIVDRKKELIKYKGLQVAPAELEALLLSHDRIQDAAVIGVPDPDGSGNELPRAYIVADKSKISEEEIKSFVKENLAQHKQLRGGVVWLNAIPKSPSGKILRKDLRAMAKKEAKAAKL